MSKLLTKNTFKISRKNLFFLEEMKSFWEWRKNRKEESNKKKIIVHLKSFFLFLVFKRTLRLEWKKEENWVNLTPLEFWKWEEIFFLMKSNLNKTKLWVRFKILKCSSVDIFDRKYFLRINVDLSHCVTKAFEK